MSSIRGGAASAGKPKPVNVNSVYSGRNLAQGNKPLGKHGMQSVGRSLGVVRRMPPPATLPSLKAENNGQDPTINIVPQAGSGWSKGDPVEGSRPTPVVSGGTAVGPDLRPTWAKAQPAEPVAAQPVAMTGEFPTLALSTQGKETKPTNAWNAGAPNFPARTYTISGSTDDERQADLPSRYYDCGPPKSTAASSTYRPRFQGSSDARASQPNYYARMEGRERGESVCESIGGRSDGSDRRNRLTSDTFFENDDTANEGNGVPNDTGRDLAVERSRQKRMSVKPVLDEVTKEEESCSQNGHSVSQRTPHQPEYRLLKRPERIELEEGSEEEDVQLTKLNKPAVRIMKRVAVGNENEDGFKEPEMASVSMPQKPLAQKVSPQPERKLDILRREDRPSVPKNASKLSPENIIEKHADEIVLPAPPPAENIWAKRKEERESQEKEKDRFPKAMQQAIEQHFPKVGDSASVKIDKDLARRPADAEFTRAAMRARQPPVSNDVRKIMRNDDDRKQQFSRDDHNGDRECSNQRYQRPARENSDVGDYRYNYGRSQRGNGRDHYNESPTNKHPDEFEDRSDSHRHHYEREGFVPRGGRQQVPKVSVGRGRGRGRPINVQHQTQRPHPQYQIQKRPQHKEDNSAEVLMDTTPTAEQTINELAVSTEQTHEDSPKNEPSQSSSEILADDRVGASVERNVHSGFRGRGGRGRGMRGDDRRRVGNQQFRDGMQDQRPRKPKTFEGGEKLDSRLDQGRNFSNSRGTYSQQRPRRGQQRVVVQKTGRPAPPSRSSEEPISLDDNRLKSPVVSSEGHEEWETASESSNRIQRQERTEKERSLENVSNNGHKISAERIRSKNVQPARRTCRSPSDGNSKQPPSEIAKQPSPDKPSDGLAGLDINNIASVVVIDEHLQESVTPEASAEFEEVMNKKMRKQKALEQQMKQEAEERKRLKEKERLEKMQAKKVARLQAKKEQKKDDRKKQESAEKLNEVAAKKDDRSDKEVAPDKVTVQSSTASRNFISAQKKEVPVTTVWNSAHVAAMDKQRLEDASMLPSHIPSPIARPTPKSKASDKSKEDHHPIVELPVSLSADNHLRGSETYDFTFDPDIHEAQTRELQEKNNSNVSSIGASESGSASDDLKMKEKIIKLKDLWGEGDRENATPLPSNVAKVKPQPQGEQSSTDVAKGDQPSGTTGTVVPQQRSPSITPFSASAFGGISFPNYLPDMASGYHGGSIMPPPNAISPPTTMPGPYMQQRPGGRATFMDNSMYNPIAAQQRQQSMWAPNAAVDNVMPFGNTPPPSIMQQGNSAQFNFNNRTNMHHPPPQMQRGYPPNNMGNGQQKMGNGPPIMFGPPQMPMDMMGMNLPPPHHGNPHLGAVGSQRNDRPQPFASLMGNSFPPAQPPPHFNQPPPSVDMRFAQPPPPFGHDMWNQNKHFTSHQPSMGGNFRGQPPMNRGLPMHGNDVWTSSSMQTFNPHNNGPHRMAGGMQKNGLRGVGGAQNHHHHHHQQQQQQLHHDRGDMKRPAVQQTSNGASA